MFRRAACCCFTLAVFLNVTGARLLAQSCSQELARQETALRQFEDDARRESIDFALEDPRRAALAAVSKRLQGDPTADAAKEIKARWDEYQSFLNQVKKYETMMQELSRCVSGAGGASGCLTEIVQRNTEAGRMLDRVNDAVKRWVDSLGTESISRAAARGERARSIMQNFTARAAGSATQAASQGIDSCLRDFDRRVQQNEAGRLPVNTQQPPRANPPAAKKGSSTGKVVALSMIAAGGVAGAALAAGQSSSDNGDSGGSQQPASSTIRVVQPGPITCTRTGGFGSQCAGTIVLDVGTVFSAGTQVVILTDPSQFLAGQIRGASSEVRFSIDQSIVNVDLNGNITCRPTQTGIYVYKDTHVGQPATALVSTTIPVTCR
jgi:hypothetical protein